MDVMQDVGQHEIDFDIDYGTSATAPQYDDGDEMSDDLPAAREIEDIELRSVTEGDEQMLDDMAVTEATDESISEITIEDVPLIDQVPDVEAFTYDTDEDLLDLSEDDDTTTPLVRPAASPFVPDGPLQAHIIDDETIEDLSVTASGVPAQDTTVDATGDAPVREGGQEDAHHVQVETVPQVLHESAVYSLDHTTDGDRSGPNESTPIAESQKIQNSDRQYSTEELMQHEAEDRSKEAYVEIEGELGGQGMQETEDGQATGVPELKEEHQANDEQQIVSEEQVLEPAGLSSTGEQTYTGLHTTIVKYAGSEYFLFPPNTSQEHTHEGVDFLLEDENLSISSIGDMLHACRLVMGSSLTEDEELEMHIEELDLILGQDAPAAFSTSFSELLDIYVSLYRNDGFEHIPVMVVSFNTRPRFAHRLRFLVNYAAEGKGLLGSRSQQDGFVHNETNDIDNHLHQKSEPVEKDAQDSTAYAEDNGKVGRTFSVPDEESDVTAEEGDREEFTALTAEILSETQAEQAETELVTDDASSHTLSVADIIFSAEDGDSAYPFDDQDQLILAQSSKTSKPESNDDHVDSAPAIEDNGQDGLAAAVHSEQPQSGSHGNDAAGVPPTVIADTNEQPDDFEESDGFDEIDYDDEIVSVAQLESSDSTPARSGQKRGFAAESKLNDQDSKRSRPS